MPKTLAASVTLKLKGSRQASLMEWPGCGGFFIGMVSSPLVVVHQINVERVTVNEAENNPPVAGYRNALHALKIALESVKAIARQIKIRRPLRPIQVTENVRDPAHLISTDPARFPLVEAF
jgi:hypothetical protein